MKMKFLNKISDSEHSVLKIREIREIRGAIIIAISVISPSLIALSNFRRIIRAAARIIRYRDDYKSSCPDERGGGV